MEKHPTTPRKSPGQRPRTTRDVPAAPIGPWVDLAACVTAEPEIFFPVGNEPDATAKQYCARCIVRDYCREYALAAGEEFGVWGGLNEAERRSMLARAKRERATRLAGGAA